MPRSGEYLPISERQRLHAMQRFRERYDGKMSVRAYLTLCEKAAVIGPGRVLLSAQGEHQILALHVCGEWLPVAFDLVTRRINSFLPHRALGDHRFVPPDPPAETPKPSRVLKPFKDAGEPMPFLDFLAACDNWPSGLVGRAYLVYLWLSGRADKRELTKPMVAAGRVLAGLDKMPEPADICRVLHDV